VPIAHLKRKAIALALGVASEGIFTAVAMRGFGPCGASGVMASIWFGVHLPALLLLMLLNETIGTILVLSTYSILFASLWYLGFLKPARERN
jgi:hypothetical protein